MYYMHYVLQTLRKMKKINVTSSVPVAPLLYDRRCSLSIMPLTMKAFDKYLVAGMDKQWMRARKPTWVQ